MKTIGLIGGMTWDSTAVYYELINRAVQKRLGGVHSAKIVMISLDFARPEEMARTARWDDLAVLMIASAEKLKACGAELLLMCANTAHRVAERVETASGLPLLHICDCTAAAIKADRLKRVVLLGTRYTMEEDFFKDRLAARGLDVFVPDAEGRAAIHRAIEEVWRDGKSGEASRASALAVVAQALANGAEAVILGCTELPAVIRPQDCAVPLYDTTELHALAAVDAALS